MRPCLLHTLRVFSADWGCRGRTQLKLKMRKFAHIVNKGSRGSWKGFSFFFHTIFHFLLLFLSLKAVSHMKHYMLKYQSNWSGKDERNLICWILIIEWIQIGSKVTRWLIEKIRRFSRIFLLVKLSPNLILVCVLCVG